MLPIDPHSRLYFAFALGLGVAFVGVVGALVRPGRRGQVLAGLLGCGLSSATAAAFDPDLATTVGAATGLFVLAWQALRMVDVSGLARRALSVWRIDRAPWVALAVVGVALLVTELVRFDRILEAQATADTQDLFAQIFAVPASEDVASLAFTDSGVTVPLVRTLEQRSPEDMTSAEESALNRLPNRNQLIKRAAANDQCNCHGWVFTGGRYGVHGSDVDRILRDNRYTKVIDPRTGDLCVYRGTGDEVLHTAVVRAVCPDGTVLVEGKWGWMGVYLHPAGQSCYGERFGFYHSARDGHLLAGMAALPHPGTTVASLVTR